MELEPPRGMKDWLPAEEALRQEAAAKLRRVFELYGFVPLQTPALERFEVLASKYAGGEEILKETYSLEDLGKRRLGLRYDLTVPLCRLLAGNPRFGRPWPFKRYQIGLVWRDGPVSSTRLREFLQCDVDTIGSGNALADAEIIALTCDGLRALGFKRFAVRVSSRKLLNGLLAEAGVEEGKRLPAMLSLDKLAKTGREKVLEELVGERGISQEAAQKLLALVDFKGTNQEILAELSRLPACGEGVKELREIFECLAALGIGEEVRLDVSLARGLAYYTGTVFEAYLEDSVVKDAVAAGGRFDALVAKFSDSKESTPAVGVSFGLERLLEALQTQAGGKTAEKTLKSSAKAFVAPVKALKEGIAACAALRRAGIACEIDLMQRGIGENLDYVNRAGIPYAVIVGRKEVDENKFRLRDMKTGEEKLLSEGELLKALK